MNNITPVLFQSKNECCGCSACYSVCPANAITMKMDSEGFFYPEINETQCVNCKKCLQSCKFKTDLLNKQSNVECPKVFAGKIKDEIVRKASSSGGMFTSFSDVFLLNGDAVVCSSYNYTSNQQEVKLVTSAAERDNARGSKYIQSVPGEVYREVEKWLKENPTKSVLFVGLGCQASGFLNYANLRGFRNRLVVVDIICHGVSSPLVWKDYVRTLTRGNKILTELSFKDKRNGWKSPYAYAKVDGQEISLKDYVDLYYSCNISRPSCHICPYASLNRESDITIGDFWGIETVIPDFYDSNGVSLILLHTLKGMELFNQVRDKIVWIESTVSECIQPNLVHPTPISKHRDIFWREYNKYGIEHAIKKYGKKSLVSRITRRIKTMLGKKN